MTKYIRLNSMRAETACFPRQAQDLGQGLAQTSKQRHTAPRMNEWTVNSYNHTPTTNQRNLLQTT